jgi:hypothetical protein
MAASYYKVHPVTKADAQSQLPRASAPIRMAVGRPFLLTSPDIIPDIRLLKGEVSTGIVNLAVVRLSDPC